MEKEKEGLTEDQKRKILHTAKNIQDYTAQCLDDLFHDLGIDKKAG